MKRLSTYIYNNVVATLLLLFAFASAAYGQVTASQAGQIEISLLTCGPRPNVYSLYGHTAIRYTDRAQGVDVAVNYGMFSFDKPYFVLRFVFGLTDYEMGIEDFSDFVSHYEPSGCGIRQQVLNLTPGEKVAIGRAISENYLPQNRVYRYNYFYDNCTSRARDIITRNLGGTLRYSGDEGREYPSFRDLVHGYNEAHRWARFGNDLLLGVKADLPTDFAQQQFLPERLSTDFDKASIVGNDGKVRKLVARSVWVLPRTNGVGADDFPLSPMACMCIVALALIGTAALERRTYKVFWGVDVAMMTVAGLCGIVLFAMVFSQHPTVSLNLQILFLNPLALVAVWPVAKGLRDHKATVWFKAWNCMLVAFVLCAFLQSYAEGLIFVALSLLLRNMNTLHVIRNNAVKAARK